jgi:non-ribosomal peptide synthetase component F
LKEFFDLYFAYCDGCEVRLEKSHLYRDYIAWLQEQDVKKAENFWRQALAGFTRPTLLSSYDPGESIINSGERYGLGQIRVDSITYEALLSFAHSNQLTLNTLTQGAWALVLSHYSGAQDVCFGVVTSGRPADLPGVDSMKGLFISNLPARVQLAQNDRLVPWLKKLQDQQAKAREYEYSPLVQIQKWSEVSRGLPLFDSNVVFENYPVSDSLRDSGRAFKFSNIHVFAQANYPLTLSVMPGANLVLRLEYNNAKFDAKRADQVLSDLRLVLGQMVVMPETDLQSLLNDIAEAQRERQQVKERELKETRLKKFDRLKRRTTFSQ